MLIAPVLFAAEVLCSGVVLFDHSSDTSLRDGTRVSYLTNKQMNGRKRYLMADKIGLPLATGVSAAHWQDGIEGMGRPALSYCGS